MDQRDLKQAVIEWSDKIGAHKARARLAERKLSTSLIDKLLGGRYPSTLKPLYAEVLAQEMAKDGFVLTDEAV